MYLGVNNPYLLSRDYDRLLALLAERKEIVCFVDYNFFGSTSEPSRDVCSARCFEDDNYIRISARGVQYNNALVQLSERDKFIQDCERMNLEFIDPQSAATSTKGEQC